MLLKLTGLVILQLSLSWGFYTSDDDVVQLTPENFKSRVLDSDELWLIEFYAPWCGHCERLKDTWKELASDFKGVANIGAVDADQHKSLAGQYGVRGFPTIKAFGYDKNSPIDYQGQRDLDALSEYVIRQSKELKKTKREGGRKSGGSSGGHGGGGGGSSGSNDVVTLTDANFKELVLDSKETWLVEFYAPWCGHCKNLEPHWRAAATEVKEKTEGSVKLGALDATVHQVTASRYGIRGYPTIKVFRQGFKSESPVDYDGARDTSGIVSKAMEYYVENIDPPTIDELVSQEVFDEKCAKQLCVISFLPDITEGGKDSRNQYIDLLKKLGEAYKKQKWGWAWVPALTLPKLEKAVSVGGFGYPAVVAINVRKEVYGSHVGSFNEEGLRGFLGVLTYGRGKLHTHAIAKDKLPEIETREPWDGEDAPPVEEEDYDLSDFKWDDEL